MWHKQMSHLSLTNLSFCTYKWVVLPIQTCHVAHTNESWHTYKWVTSHMQMSHVAYTNEWYCLYKFYMSRCVIQIDTLCHAHGLVVSHTWMKHTHGWNTHMDESIYKRVILPLQVRHVALTNESRPSCGWVISYIEVSHVPLMNESCQKTQKSKSRGQTSSDPRHLWMSHCPHMD